MKHLIAVTALLCLAYGQESYSRKCIKTARAIPFTSKKPIKTSKSQVCSMFETTCCGYLAEAEMKKMAKNDFTEKLLLIKKALQSVSDPLVISQLTPVVFSPEFNVKVQSAGDVTLQELARVAVSGYVKESCEDEIDAMAWEVSADVKSVANNLAAIYQGITTIKSALEVISEYKISDECVAAIMKNGVPVRADYKNTMCQACTRESFDNITCSNTCRNTVQGCYNELTGIAAGLDRLSLNLDKVHYNLRKDIDAADGALNKVEQKIQQIFDEDKNLKEECSNGVESTFVEMESLAQPSNFSSKPLDLKNIMLKSVDLHCIKSRNLKKCWTANGYGDDDQSLLTFTTEDQYKNTILPKQDTTSEVIVNEETKLNEAIKTAAIAQTTADLFREEEKPVPPTEPKPEPTEPKVDEDEESDDTEEKEMGDGDKDMEEKEEDEKKGEENVDSDDDDNKDDVDEKDSEVEGSKDNEEKKEDGMEKEKEEDKEESNNTEDKDDKGDKDDDGYDANNDKEEEEELDTNAVEGKSTDKNNAMVSSISSLILSFIFIRLTA